MKNLFSVIKNFIREEVFQLPPVRKYTNLADIKRNEFKRLVDEYNRCFYLVQNVEKEMDKGSWLCSTLPRYTNRAIRHKFKYDQKIWQLQQAWDNLHTWMKENPMYANEDRLDIKIEDVKSIRSLLGRYGSGYGESSIMH